MLVIKARGQDKLCQLLLHRATTLSRDDPAIKVTLIVIKSQDQQRSITLTLRRD